MMAWMMEHYWMTFFMAVSAIGAVRDIVLALVALFRRETT